ncbi:MAG TPA: hypothetical protein DDY13_10585 [Cytophagales bacterium]|jgi:dTDP-4-amino-4,6-dideoxygalactose transaminase|nr:hypothetical protein [Cytophagales bacterium]
MYYIPFYNLEYQHKAIYNFLIEKTHKEIQQGQFVNGEEVEFFEKRWRNYNSSKFCCTCANGTDALELIFQSISLQEGDEVIVPALSFISTVTSILKFRAKPVFCDIDPKCQTIDSSQIHELVTVKTKAIVVVHLHGYLVDVQKIFKQIDDGNIIIIEDAAQAHGALHDNQNPGKYSSVVAYSFYPTKNLGALGDGGCVTTNDKVLYEEIQLLKNYGSYDQSNVVKYGRNSRLDTIQAAWLNVKLNKLDEWNLKRIEIASLYDNYLKDLPIILPPLYQSRRHVYHHYVIQLEDNRRDELKVYLESKGVETKIHYPRTLNKLSIVKCGTVCPNAERVANRSLSLPIYPGLTNDQIDYICTQISDFFKN